MWRDEAKFKNLGTQSEPELSILTSFGVAVARVVLTAAPLARVPAQGLTAAALRQAILESAAVVNLGDLLAFCWGVGIPVLQMDLFPLGPKRMHAITVRSDDRFVILLGRRSSYQAQVAYTIAHEIGHVALSHLAEVPALVDADDPLRAASDDSEELEADSYALEVLTGERQPVVKANIEAFSSAQLADAAVTASAEYRVDPGVLALCLAHVSRRWRQGFGALKGIPPYAQDVAAYVNGVAGVQLDWTSLSVENREYLRKVMGTAVEP